MKRKAFQKSQKEWVRDYLLHRLSIDRNIASTHRDIQNLSAVISQLREDGFIVVVDRNNRKWRMPKEARIVYKMKENMNGFVKDISEGMTRVPYEKLITSTDKSNYLMFKTGEFAWIAKGISLVQTHPETKVMSIDMPDWLYEKIFEDGK